MIEAAHRLAAGNADAVTLCTDGAQVDRTVAEGRIALVLALESAPGVGEDVELLETLFRLGVRIASLAHFGRTSLADGSGEDATGGRLTRAGARRWPRWSASACSTTSVISARPGSSTSWSCPHGR